MFVGALLVIFPGLDCPIGHAQGGAPASIQSWSQSPATPWQYLLADTGPLRKRHVVLYFDTSSCLRFPVAVVDAMSSPQWQSKGCDWSTK